MISPYAKLILKWVTCDNIELSEDARFNYFTTRLWEKFNESLLYHTLIFTSSYFDFVKLKWFFKIKNSDVTFLHEHMEDVEALKARNWFEYEWSRFLLISERALVFNKVDLWYVKNIIFYTLPESTEITWRLLSLLNPEAGL